MSKAPEVTIVDYGMGNIRSLGRALERAGAAVKVSDDAAAVGAAERVVIPGQGAFGQAMNRLRERALVAPLQAAVASGRPVLGVCLGLQVLYQGSEEAPGVEGLGILPGTVRLLPLGPGLKRPHMGWTPVQHADDHPVFSVNPSGTPFYFVHSYAALEAPRVSRASAAHGIDFVAAVARAYVVATQFHPEKSQEAGERLLRAWLHL